MFSRKIWAFNIFLYVSVFKFNKKLHKETKMRNANKRKGF